MKIDDKGQCPYQSSTWMRFLNMRVIQLQGTAWCAWSSVVDSQLCLCVFGGILFLQARGVVRHENTQGTWDVLGRGSGRPHLCNRSRVRHGCRLGARCRYWSWWLWAWYGYWSWWLWVWERAVLGTGGGRGRPDWGGGLVVSGVTGTFWVAGSPVVWPGTIMMGIREMTDVYFLRNFCCEG